MKLKHKILKATAFVAALGLIGTGCLKDQLEDDKLAIPDIAGARNLIEIPGTVAAYDTYHSYSVASLSPGTKDTTIDFVYVRLASGEPATQDIKVQLEWNDDILEAFNDSTGRHGEPIDPALYKLDPANLLVTIPKGQREGAIRLTIKPVDIQSGDFAFGLKIKSVEPAQYGISGNFNNSIVTVIVKNKYDGIYTYRFMQSGAGWAPFALQNEPKTWANPVPLVTTGENTVVLQNSSAQVEHPGWGADGTGIVWGGTRCQFKFDLATNKLIEVRNLNPDLPRGRSFRINPLVTDSRYDPATRTIYAAYFINQGGRGDMAYYDTLTYRSAR